MPFGPKSETTTAYRTNTIPGAGSQTPLTVAQMQELRKVCQEHPSHERAAILMRLADEWGVEWRQLVDAYGEINATPRSGKKASLRVPLHLTPEWQEESPVAEVTVEPGEFPTMPRNAALLMARLKTGKGIHEICVACAVAQSHYRGFEQGWRLPTPLEAKRIATFLGHTVEELFPLTGPEQVHGNSVARNLSVLAFLRSARGILKRDLPTIIFQETGRTVSSETINMIEAGKYQTDVGRDDELAVLAEYFGLAKPHHIKAMLPDMVLEQAMNNTKFLHATFAETLATVEPLRLSAPDGSESRLLIGEGDGD